MEQIYTEGYHLEDVKLYAKTYHYIQGYAIGRGFTNTIKALPLARTLHDGQYRKGTIEYEGETVKLPYLVHVLKVCTTLMALNLPLDDHELDILYASALLHDTLEDCLDKLPRAGMEFIKDYNLDGEILDIVRLLSKRTGSSEEELNEYFNAIKYDKKALLVKLSDRSHNVETLSVMKLDKLHKYVNETKTYIYPLCSYAKQHYPELTNGITLLKSKIVSLTEATETLVNKFEEELALLKNTSKGEEE